MVIYIRGADPALIKAIDKYAERKHLSRSAFLLQALENMVSIQDFSGMESRYKMLLEKCLDVIENNTLALQKISAGEEENQAPSDWR